MFHIMRRLNIFERLFHTGNNGMIVDSDSFLETLANSKDDTTEKKAWWHIPFLKGAHFMIIVSIGLLMLTILISYSVIFIKDVLLHDNKLFINSQGAFNPHKALDCEYAMYLFNTADLWANSGIQVRKRDRIKINVSGAYHSSIEYLEKSSEDNYSPKYRWMYFRDKSLAKAKTDPKESVDAEKYCIYRYPDKKAKYFGAPLFGIFPESSDVHHNPLIDTIESASRVEEWSEIRGRRFHKVSNNGVLYFAVNDMFDAECFYRDTKNRKYDGSKYDQDAVKEVLQQRPYHDYEDNLGQLMVSVEIIRYDRHGFINPLRAYRMLEYGIEDAMTRPLVICVFFILGLLIFFLVWITLLFGLASIGVIASIYLVFLIGGWLHKQLW